MRLAGKVALITGGGSGIGRATAALFAREGARVAVADRDVEGGSETVDQIRSAGGEAAFVEVDVSLVDDCRKMVDETVAAFGSLNVLLNNAGVVEFRTTEATTEREWDRLHAINLKGVFSARRRRLRR